MKANSALVPPGDYDAYAVIEYFDGRPQIARVQYDASPVIRERNSFYTSAVDVVLSGGADEWQRAVVQLPHTRFGHGEYNVLSWLSFSRVVAIWNGRWAAR